MTNYKENTTQPIVSFAIRVAFSVCRMGTTAFTYLIKILGGYFHT